MKWLNAYSQAPEQKSWAHFFLSFGAALLAGSQWLGLTKWTWLYLWGWIPRTKRCMNEGKQQRICSVPPSHTTEENRAKEHGGSQEPALEKKGWVGRTKANLNSCLHLVSRHKRSGWVACQPTSSPWPSLQSQQAAGGWVPLRGEGSRAQPQPGSDAGCPPPPCCLRGAPARPWRLCQCMVGMETPKLK